MGVVVLNGSVDLRRWGPLAAVLTLQAASCRAPDVGSSEQARHPTRIVSLTPSLTEIAFAVGAGSRVVGVTRYCTYPPEAKLRSIVGGTTSQTINMETILRLQPDLVLAGGFGQEDVVAALQREGIRVSRHLVGKISDTLATILAVGDVVGNRPEAEELIAHLSEAIQRHAARAAKVARGARPKVFYLVWEDPLLTAGSQTFIGEIIELAGGQNIFGDLAKDFPRVGAETVVRRRPEVVVMPSHHGGADDTPRARATRAGLGNLLEETRCATVDGDVISRPGPRVGDAVAAMAAAIHGAAWAHRESPSR